MLSLPCSTGTRDDDCYDATRLTQGDWLEMTDQLILPATGQPPVAEQIVVTDRQPVLSTHLTETWRR